MGDYVCLNLYRSRGGGSAVWFERVGGKDRKGTGERGCRVQGAMTRGKGREIGCRKMGEGRGEVV